MSFFAQGLMELIFGGLTGYVTNDIAIKTLFKPGGVVEETRGEFTQEISRLLENEIITNEELSDKLNRTEVRQGIKQLLDHYLQEQLLSSFSQYSIEDLDDGEEFIQQLGKGIIEESKNHQELLEKLVNRIPIKQIFTDEQLEQISNRLGDLLVECIEEYSLSEKLIQQVQGLEHNVTIGSLGGETVLGKLMDNGGKLTGQIVGNILGQKEDQLTELMLTVEKQIDAKDLLVIFEQKIKELPLNQVFFISGEELIGRVKGYFASDEGAELILAMAEEVVMMAKELELTIGELVPENFIRRFGPMVQRHMPTLVQMLVQWLEDNKGQLEQQLEGAIDEVLDVEEGTKGFLLQVIRNGILDNIAEKFKVVEKLGSLLDDALGKPEIMDLVGEKIGSYLANKPLREVVQHLEEMDIDCQGLVGQFMAQNLSFYLGNIEVQKVNECLEWSIGKVYEQSIVEKYNQHYLENMIGQQINQLREDNQISQWINQFMVEERQGLLSQPIHQYPIWNSDDIDYGYWDNRLVRFIHHQQEAMLPWLQKKRDSLTPWVWLQQINQSNSLVGPMVQEKLDQLNKRNVGELYQQTALTWYHNQGKLRFEQYVIQAPNWSNGLIARLAEENMNQLSDDQVLELVQDFMGRELKPLNYLGAGLGAVAGLGAGLLLPDPAIAYSSGMAGLGALVAGKAFIFGAVGYGTNCAAIKGLFWPYQPVWGKSYIQGIIPKRQKAFASQMGKVIEEKMLDREYLENKLEENREKIVGYGTEWLDGVVDKDWLTEKVGQYQDQWIQLLLEQQEQLVQQGLELGLDKCSTKAVDITQQQLAQWADLLVQEITEEIPGYLGALSESQQPVVHLINRYWVMEKLTTVLVEKVSNIEAAEIQKYVKEQVARWKSKEVGQLFNEGIVLEKAKSWCEQRLNRDELAKTMYTGYEALAKEYTLEQLVGNRVESMLINNSDIIFNFITGEVNVYLQRHQQQLTVQIQREIEGQLGFVQLLGYQALNGPKLIHDIVIKVIDEKVPQFLYGNQQELIQVIVQFWDEHLQHNTLDDLQLNIVEEDFIQLIDTVTAHISLEQAIEKLFVPLWSRVNHVPMKDLLAVINMDEELEGIRPIVDQTWQEMVEQIHTRKPLIGRAIDEYGWPLLQEELEEIRMQHIFQDITVEMWKEVKWNSIVELVHIDQLVQPIVINFHSKLVSRPLNSWVDYLQLKQDINLHVVPVLISEQSKEAVRMISHDVLMAVVPTIPEATKRQILMIMVQSGVDTIQIHSSEILAQLGLGEIATNQIQQMNPEQLEQMVHSFGDPYFTHIKNKGWLGAVFSVPGIIINLLL